MSSSKKIIKLRSSDSQIFEVNESVMLQSQTIKFMIEDNCTDNVIPLDNVNGQTLAKIIEYCTKHANESESESESEPTPDFDHKAWDNEFLKVDQKVDPENLFNLIMAANYLNIKDLLDLTCQSVADMIRGKTPEEVRKIFNIKNDFTPEEEAAIRKENEWAFEE